MAENNTEEQDENLVNSYLDGNKEALKEIIDKYTPSLYNYARRIANKNDAPDIVSETFIKIWKSLSKFDKQKSSFKTWIFTIIRNTTTDFLRKKKNILFSDLEENSDSKNEETKNSLIENIKDENINIEEICIKLEDLKYLNQVLENISIKYKEILILHYQEEMTFNEIGILLKKPLNTVKSDHRRAILELKKRYKENNTR